MAKAKRKRTLRTRYEIDAERFVKEWTLASNVQEVATRMTITVSVAYSFARKLRDNGVELKEFKKREIDADALNQIIRETEKT